MIKLKIRAIGNSSGVVLPKEVLDRLHVSQGDALFLSEAPGGYCVAPYDDTLAKQLEVAEQVMREDRDVLRELAK